MNMRGFNAELALKVGVKTALVYNYLAVSLQNPNVKLYFKDSDLYKRKYCDVKVHEVKDWLPFMSENKIRKCLNELRDKGIIEFAITDPLDFKKPSVYRYCLLKEYETIMM